ncbi:hypothetical protein TYRP_011998 [Tyrophagus putrescentiae]|nr:hypothetical protein TYRP_011998 [Tyrophagus putrescentiae]
MGELEDAAAGEAASKDVHHHRKGNRPPGHAISVLVQRSPDIEEEAVLAVGRRCVPLRRIVQAIKRAGGLGRGRLVDARPGLSRKGLSKAFRPTVANALVEVDFDVSRQLFHFDGDAANGALFQVDNGRVVHRGGQLLDGEDAEDDHQQGHLHNYDQQFGRGEFHLQRFPLDASLAAA